MCVLTLVHRWLGILFCLLFAMWFASGMIMHFVPFPSLTEAERIDGLAPIDLSQVSRSPAEAVRASGIKDATRVRLLQRSDGPAYLVSGASSLVAFRAGDLSRAALAAGHQALAVALDHAQRRGMDWRTPRFPHSPLSISGPFPAASIRTARCFASHSMTDPTPSFMCRR